MAGSDSILETLNSDRSQRVGRVTRVAVYELYGPTTELLPPGSGVLVIASPESDAFRDLQVALELGDRNRLDELVQSHKAEQAQRKRVSIEEALRLLLEQQTYGDLRYGGKTIVMNAYAIPNSGFSRAFFPFIGGKFEAEAFTLATYSQANVAAKFDSPLTALVVVHQPTLSPRERKVVLLSPDFEEMRFAEAAEDAVLGTPAALFATVTAATIVVAVATAAGHCHFEFEKVAALELPADFDPSSPMAASQLVELRRKALFART
jgi:hypothetical protein